MKVYSIALGQLIGCVILLLGAALYTFDTYDRWRHLADWTYAIQLSLFSIGLGIIGYAIFTAAICRWNRPFLVGLASTLLVFVPARFLNERSPRILVVSVEGLRASKMSLMGAREETTPHLDNWARSELGVVLFHDATAHASEVVPSVQALLSGDALDPEAPQLNAILSEKGWDTRLAYTSATPRAGLAEGYEESFSLREESNGETSDMMRAFREWFDDAPSSSLTLLDYSAMQPVCYPEKRFDIFITPGADSREELYEFATNPGQKVSQSARVHARHHYDGSLLQMDSSLGRMLEEMEQSGELSNTLVVFTSPSGWGLFEHGEYANTGRPFDELTHVPLLVRFPSPIRFPSIRPRARNIHAPVQHADVVPTIAQFLNEDWDVEGRDLSAAAYRGQRPLDVAIPMRTTSLAGSVIGARYRGWKMFLLPNADGTTTEQFWELKRPGVESVFTRKNAPVILDLRNAVGRWYGQDSKGAKVARAHPKPAK